MPLHHKIGKSSKSNCTSPPQLHSDTNSKVLHLYPSADHNPTHVMDVTRVFSISLTLRPSSKVIVAKKLSENVLRMIAVKRGLIQEEIYPSGNFGSNGNPMYLKMVFSASPVQDPLTHVFRMAVTFCGAYHDRVSYILDKARFIVQHKILQCMAKDRLLTASLDYKQVSDSKALTAFLTAPVKPVKPVKPVVVEPDAVEPVMPTPMAFLRVADMEIIAQHFMDQEPSLSNWDLANIADRGDLPESDFSDEDMDNIDEVSMAMADPWMHFMKYQAPYLAPAF